MFVYETLTHPGVPEPKIPSGIKVKSDRTLTTVTVVKGSAFNSFTNLAAAREYLRTLVPPRNQPTPPNLSEPVQARTDWRQPRSKQKCFPAEWAQFNEYHAGTTYFKSRATIGYKERKVHVYRHLGEIWVETRRIVEFEPPFHTHNYSVRKSMVVYKYSYADDSVSYEPFTITVGGDFPQPQVNADVRKQAITSAYAQIWGGTWDPAVTLGEMPETLRMKNSVLAKYDSLVAYSKLIKQAPSFLFNRRAFTKKGMKAKYARRLSADLVSQYTDAWLTWRVVIRPMMYDFENFMKSLRQNQIVGKTAYSYRGSAKDTQHASHSTTYLGIPVEYRTSIEHSAKAVVRVKGFGASPNRFALSPLKSAWELVTMSWLVDRYVNIGDTLGAIQGKAFVGQARHCSTLRVTRTYSLHINSGVTENVVTGSIPKPGSSRYTVQVVINDTEPHVERVKQLSRYPDYDSPGFSLKRPQPNPDHSLDLFAIVWANLKKGPLIGRR